MQIDRPVGFEVPSEEQGPACCPAVASPDKHYLDRIPGGAMLGSCQEVKDHLKCRLCHCKQLVFSVHLCLGRYPGACSTHRATPGEGLSQPCLGGSTHSTRDGRDVCGVRGVRLVRAVRVPSTSPKSWAKPSCVSLGCTAEDTLLTAQHSAALVVISVDKISAECRLQALDIFDFILCCPSINITCVSSW